MAKKNSILDPFLRFRYWIIGIVAIILYIQTVSFDYALDDAIVIYDNEFTKQGLAGVLDILSHDTFRGFFKEEGKAQLVSGGRYRPLSMVTFALEWEFFGRSPWLSHGINVLLYALLCCIMMLFLEELFPNGPKVSGMILLTVLLFTVHPIHSEVVANIKGRDEIMAMLLGTLSMISLLRGKYSWAVVMMFLALLSKEMAATFVPIAVAMFWLVKKESLIKSVYRIWPLALGFGLYLILRITVLGMDSFGGEVMEMMNNPFIKVEDGMYKPFTWAEWSATILFSLGKYIQLLIAPLTLTHDYYPRHVAVMNWSDWQVILSILSYIGIGALIWVRRKEQYFTFGALFFILSLILVSNVFFPIGTHLGERFIFMASFGFMMAFVGLAWSYKGTGNLRLVALILISFLFMGRTMMRNPVWKNDFVLFTSDVKVSSNSAKCLNAAGGTIVDSCIKKGGENCNSDLLLKAVGYLEKASKIHPKYKNPYLIKGSAFYLLGQYEASVESYNKALSLDPNFESARTNIIKAYLEGAKEYGEQKGRPDKAIAMLEEALRYDKNNIEVLRMMGIAYGVKGDLNEALKFFNKIIAIDNKNADAYLNLGITYLNLGDKEKGQQWIAKAKELDPKIKVQQ